MSGSPTYDIVVIGGGAIGLSAAYECAKAGKSVLLLEKSTFYNQAGSSGDLVRMFRTMYTEDFMANLAHEALKIWDELEVDAGDDNLRLMTGLLNFGDPNYGAGGPEGTLLGPILNLKRLKMEYRELTKTQIEEEYPFRNLPDDYIGLKAPDNGVINVPLVLRTLYRLAQTYGAKLRQLTAVTKLSPIKGSDQWRIDAKTSETKESTNNISFFAEKIIVTSGAYTNHILTPSFDIHLNLDIWEMVASYWAINAGPNGTVFPSMWFQFAEDKQGRSQLFYGFPALPWTPPSLCRIAVDAATRSIKDPDQRSSCEINAEDVKDSQEFINDTILGVDSTAPAYSLNCLQTNVFDNMFVLDFLPDKYLKGGKKDSIAIFTAGWAMKFVPLLGRALKEMVVDGTSPYAMKEFAIERTDTSTGQPILVPGPVEAESVQATLALGRSNKGGSSMRH